MRVNGADFMIKKAIKNTLRGSVNPIPALNV